VFYFKGANDKNHSGSNGSGGGRTREGVAVTLDKGAMLMSVEAKAPPPNHDVFDRYCPR
jgi:hypothetical protein